MLGETTSQKIGFPPLRQLPVRDLLDWRGQGDS
jgi:hypothetical protein